MKNIIAEQSTLPSMGNGSKIIFGCIVGSHAYGTNVEGSDVDRKWVYVQSAEDLFINGYKQQVEFSKDETAFELSRFLELLKKGNPTILEMLFSPADCIIYCHKTFKRIISARKTFLTKQCRLSFGGYAISQIEKAEGLQKKMNWEKSRTERKSVLDFCYYLVQGTKVTDKYESYPIKTKFNVEMLEVMGLAAIPHAKNLYNIFMDIEANFKGIVQDEATSNDISLSEIPKDTTCIGLLYFNKEGYQAHCKDYREYKDWLDNRNTQRYVDIENHQQQIDGKNMLHCIRLIETAVDIAQYRELIVRRENAEWLKDIRHGKVDLKEILAHARAGMEAMDLSFKNSTLPEKYVLTTLLKYMNTNIRKEIQHEQQSVV